MNLFINDISIRIIKKNEKPDLAKFSRVLDARKDIIGKALLTNHLLITNASAVHLNALLAAINAKDSLGLLE